MGEPPISSRGSDFIARFLYALLWFVATPFVASYLLWRTRRQARYRRGWRERFAARYAQRPEGRLIWIHAVSVGETRAAAALVMALRVHHPDLLVLVTHMTPTGLATSTELFGDDVVHAYLAYDYPFAVRRFLAHWRPALGIVMETEIWPNLMAAAHAAGIPMVLANARLSKKSLAGALRWKALMRPAARRFQKILAQTDADASRFSDLLALRESGTNVAIMRTGNIKFDLEADEAQRELGAIFRARVMPEAASGEAMRPVLLAASTRDGEEILLLDAWRRRQTSLEMNHPLHDALLVIVPRHPQRFDDVARLIVARGFTMQRRSDERPVTASTEVWLGDSMGELFAYYTAADLAYIGGSLVPLGGQNLIEAATVGCPALIGPHTFNFAEATDDAVAAGAARRVADADALMIAADALLSDDVTRQAMAEAGRRFAAAHRGATARTLSVLEAWLA